MKRFVIDATIRIDKTLKIPAETEQEAIEKARAALPDYTIEAVDGRMVIATCEVSGKPIFEGDDYLCDDEGVYWLRQYDDPSFYEPTNEE